MYIFYDIRTCQTEQVIISFQWLVMIFKLIALEILLLEFVLLYHGAHRSIKYHDSLVECSKDASLKININNIVHGSQILYNRMHRLKSNVELTCELPSTLL